MALELFPPEEISERYYSILDTISKTKNDEDKLYGKYYTNDWVIKNLISAFEESWINNYNENKISIIDPFCGDGRLILALLHLFEEDSKYDNYHFKVSLWDIDEDALFEAKQQIIEFMKRSDLRIECDFVNEDAFVKYREHKGKFDICITNPPWGLLKPAKFIDKNQDKQLVIEYKNAIEEYDMYINNEFTLSVPTSKFGKWGTNLARCGVELSLKLTKDNGYCAVVSPASLFTDQVSVPLRQWMFEKSTFFEINYYPAELKLFDKVDMSVVAFVSKKTKSMDLPNITLYDKDRSVIESEVLTEDFYSYIKSQDFILPFKLGLKAIPVLEYFNGYQSLIELTDKHSMKFTRELDETRVGEKLLDQGRIRFAKGYMVDRYTFTKEELYLNEDIVISPETVGKPKIVWRDVSRDSQIRRIKATILPSGFICGNSLGVISGSREVLDTMKILLAILNSMIFEYQARAKLVSNHVSSRVLKQLMVPKISKNSTIIELVDKQLKNGGCEDDLEVEVAKLYNMPISMFNIIVNSFRIEETRKNKIIDKYTDEMKGENSL